MRRIFMISIYIRHKKHTKTREDSLKNLQGKLFRCCPKTSANLQKKIAWNLFEDRIFSRKGFHARSFLKCFPKSKPVCRSFSILKVFLKKFAKLTERYIYRRLFFNKGEGCKLKRNSGAGAFL